MSYVDTVNIKGYESKTPAWQSPRLDASTHSWQVIDYEHHEIHSGSSFVVADCTDLGNGASRELLIVTPNTAKWAHLLVKIITESEAHWYLYEDATTSSDGTGLTEVNRNRNSATTATAVVTHTPTLTGDGTLIYQEHYGSGRGNGGENRGESEFVLKQNAKYLVRLTNATTSANYVTIVLDWYEHTDAS